MPNPLSSFLAASIAVFILLAALVSYLPDSALVVLERLPAKRILVVLSLFVAAVASCAAYFLIMVPSLRRFLVAIAFAVVVFGGGAMTFKNRPEIQLKASDNSQFPEFKLTWSGPRDDWATFGIFCATACFAFGVIVLYVGVDYYEHWRANAN